MCEERTEIYSRVVGYFRPVSSWNEGKQEEFKDRAFFNIEHAKIVAGSEKSR